MQVRLKNLGIIIIIQTKNLLALDLLIKNYPNLLFELNSPSSLLKSKENHYECFDEIIGAV